MNIPYTKNVFNQSTPIAPSGQTSSNTSQQKPSNLGSASASSGSIRTNTENSPSSLPSNPLSSSFSDPNTDFSNFLKAALGGDGKASVSEEELYSGIIFQKLQSKSEEIASTFNNAKASLMNTLQRSDGVYSHEELALSALQSVVSAGLLTQEEAEKINGEAFNAAQLDSNTETLFDDRGSASDPTIAIAALNEALTKAQTAMQEIQDGTRQVSSRALQSNASSATPNNGNVSIVSSSNGQISEQNLDGPGGFVWKPVSDSDSKLVVLLPALYAGMIKKVEVHSSLPPTEDTKLEEGEYKYDSNGGRPTFRFNKPGSQYGDNLHVVAYKEDGSMLSWSIKDGGQRYD